MESEGSHFYTLCKAVMELCKKTPLPEPLPAFCYALSHAPADDQAEESPEPPSTEVKVSVDVYKYRGSKKKRAFVPEFPSSPQPSMDFLSLDVGTAITSRKATLHTCIRKLEVEPVDVQDERTSKGTLIMCTQPKFHYQPMRLKQTVPNPKKIRKKELKKTKK